MPSAGLFWPACTAPLDEAAAEMQGSDVEATLQRIAVQPVFVTDSTPLGFSREQCLPGFPTSTIICRSGRSSNAFTGSSPRMFTSAGCVVSVPGRANVAFLSTTAFAICRLTLELESQGYLKHPTQYSIALSQRKRLPWQKFTYGRTTGAHGRKEESKSLVHVKGRCCIRLSALHKHTIK